MADNCKGVDASNIQGIKFADDITLWRNTLGFVLAESTDPDYAKNTLIYTGNTCPCSSECPPSDDPYYCYVEYWVVCDKRGYPHIDGMPLPEGSDACVCHKMIADPVLHENVLLSELLEILHKNGYNPEPAPGVRIRNQWSEASYFIETNGAQIKVAHGNDITEKHIILGKSFIRPEGRIITYNNQLIEYPLYEVFRGPIHVINIVSGPAYYKYPWNSPLRAHTNNIYTVPCYTDVSYQPECLDAEESESASAASTNSDDEELVECKTPHYYPCKTWSADTPQTLSFSDRVPIYSAVRGHPCGGTGVTLNVGVTYGSEAETVACACANLSADEFAAHLYESSDITLNAIIATSNVLGLPVRHEIFEANTDNDIHLSSASFLTAVEHGSYKNDAYKLETYNCLTEGNECAHTDLVYIPGYARIDKPDTSSNDETEGATPPAGYEVSHIGRTPDTMREGSTSDIAVPGSRIRYIKLYGNPNNTQFYDTEDVDGVMITATTCAFNALTDNSFAYNKKAAAGRAFKVTCDASKEHPHVESVILESWQDLQLSYGGTSTKYVDYKDYCAYFAYKLPIPQPLPQFFLYARLLAAKTSWRLPCTVESKWLYSTIHTDVEPKPGKDSPEQIESRYSEYFTDYSATWFTKFYGENSGADDGALSNEETENTYYLTPPLDFMVADVQPILPNSDNESTSFHYKRAVDVVQLKRFLSSSDTEIELEGYAQVVNSTGADVTFTLVKVPYSNSRFAYYDDLDVPGSTRVYLKAVVNSYTPTGKDSFPLNLSKLALIVNIGLTDDVSPNTQPKETYYTSSTTSLEETEPTVESRPYRRLGSFTYDYFTSTLPSVRPYINYDSDDAYYSYQFPVKESYAVTDKSKVDDRHPLYAPPTNRDILLNCMKALSGLRMYGDETDTTCWETVWEPAVAELDKKGLSLFSDLENPEEDDSGLIHIMVSGLTTNHIRLSCVNARDDHGVDFESDDLFNTNKEGMPARQCDDYYVINKDETTSSAQSTTTTTDTEPVDSIDHEYEVKWMRASAPPYPDNYATQYLYDMCFIGLYLAGTTSGSGSTAGSLTIDDVHIADPISTYCYVYTNGPDHSFERDMTDNYVGLMSRYKFTFNWVPCALCADTISVSGTALVRAVDVCCSSLCALHCSQCDPESTADYEFYDPNLGDFKFEVKLVGGTNTTTQSVPIAWVDSPGWETLDQKTGPLTTCADDDDTKSGGSMHEEMSKPATDPIPYVFQSCQQHMYVSDIETVVQTAALASSATSVTTASSTPLTTSASMSVTATLLAEMPEELR